MGIMGYRSEVTAVFYVHKMNEHDWPALKLFVDCLLYTSDAADE